MNIRFVDILEVDHDLIEQVRLWRNNENVSKFMFTNHKISEEEHNRWIKNLRVKNDSKAWIIFIDEKPIGLVSLSDIDYERKETEWGFYIADEDFRGKGLGKTVLKKLMKMVFDDMGFEKMNTMVLDNNPVALHLYKKLGFRVLGNHNEKNVRDGEEVEIKIMSISKTTWVNMNQVK